MAKPADGVTTMTDACVYDDAAAPADVLFVPGGLGTRALQHDAKFVARLAELAARATVVLSVCTGSLLLAASGALSGKKATTNKVAFDEIASQHPSVQWQKAARWSVDGKFYTSSGVAAGIDLARFFLKELFSTKVAQMACNVAEYQHSEDADHDPFAHRTSKPVLKNSLGRTLRLVLVAYDQFEMLDTFGPLEMFAVANRLLVRQGEKPAFELTSVAEDQLTKSFEGPVFCMDQVLQNATRLEEIDLLLLPGGIGTIREIYNPLFQHSIRALVESSQRVMTVCTGSAILGSAGLLENRRGTTNKLAFDLMQLFAPRVKWFPTARWVVDGKFYTSSGVSAGTDLSLALLRELFGAQLATAVADHAEYCWEATDEGTVDPFTHTIPKQTLGHRIFTRVQKAVVGMIFWLGFKCGFKMQITRSLI
ncbi:Isonitrile hydratase (Cyclohexyl-isocyanide hydratase) [Durusdinium trenchii]